MKKLTLLETNPYLKGQHRKALLARSVVTSCGVEGVKVNLATMLDIDIPRRPKRIYGEVKK